MKTKSVFAAAMLLIVAGLIGCGQKGPLYLPKEAPQAASKPAPQ
ncbi:MAG: lipoprotein [Paucibacter sp.]|nr:lipoprotein [Roseateles sp.]